MATIVKNGQIYAYSDTPPVTTNLDETSTHNQIPSAKAVYDKLANFDVDVDLSDLYSKTEVNVLLDNKSNIDHTHNYIESSSIVTELDGTSTDETVPSSKTVYDAIQSTTPNIETLINGRYCGSYFGRIDFLYSGGIISAYCLDSNVGITPSSSFIFEYTKTTD